MKLMEVARISGLMHRCLMLRVVMGDVHECERSLSP